MDTSFPSPSSTGSSVFRGACAVLGVVALAQGAAVAMAWKDKSHQAPVVTAAPAVPPPAPPAAAPAPPAAAPAPAADDPFRADAVVLDDPHPELAVPAGEEPLYPDPAGPVLARPNVITAAPLDVPITDEACLTHLDEGIYLRDRGDMIGAVKHLRLALEKAPEHPKLLYQLASAMDGMGQERKAAEHWRKLRLLGQGAGNYYQLAVERLKEGGSLPPPANAPAEPADEEKEGRFVVSNVKVDRLPDNAQGEVWSISGQIDHKGTEPVDVSQIAVKLHLFDEVNGQRIDRFIGEQPPHSWPDAPVDWSAGSEKFLFVFNRPPFTPDELVRLGQRKYYGYALEIRYGNAAEFSGNQLQDIAAEPAILADMAREMLEQAPGPAVPENGEMFDPAMPAVTPDQPGALLFPGDKF